MRFTLTLLAAAAIATAATAQQSALASVPFDAGQAALNPQTLAGLDHSIAPLRQISGSWSLTVIGHADPSEGEAKETDALSDRRAGVVRDALVARGVPASLITTMARGASDPAPGATGPADNRRVEITIGRGSGW
ncbi:OmpA family protein [Brevundimonas sp.]|uniref:OmpA family protein n=1 Tax=Brevundimonas sp. TaxID=1871086 RepID=UPI002D6A3FAD|nr:OmpA family protein [Brevundimonas sp.]HYC69123.1 OmpA family protein [Brevundimonas sp.]